MKNALTLILLLTANLVFAQTYKITGTIVNEHNSPLRNVTIEAQKVKTSSNTDGKYELKLAKGRHRITFKHIGYKTISQTISINNDSTLNIIFSNIAQEIEEVYVTAQESKSTSTSSVITKEAMQLLQPSSFADVLELLPGGRAQDPNLTTFNPIKIREVNLKGKAITSEKYDMSSLGVSFYVDGAPISTNANLQSLDNYTTSANTSSRQTTNRGVDLRALNTDDIEKITIIRGIPSVEYGDLTSGLVLIDRKKGASKYDFRAKTDAFGKLFALGKGFSFKDSLFVNMDLSYIRATSNPTNSFENFSRATGSIRLNKIWSGAYTYNWKSNFDYNTTLDNVKIDPDNSTLLDKYYSRNQRFALSNEFKINFKTAKWIDELIFNSSFSLQKDIVDEDKWIQARTATILINSLTEGSHEAQFLTPSYLSSIFVEGLPFSAFHKLISKHQVSYKQLSNKLLFGLESNFSKNFGNGQVYDLNFPSIVNQSVTARPRAFKDVPAYHTLSAFAEDNLEWKIQDFKINTTIGVRAFTMTSLDDKYVMFDKIYAEPRSNLRIHLPKFFVYNKPFEIILGAGYGLHRKTPTLDYFYPNLEYRDIVELNFYHNNPDFRIAQAYTSIANPTNFSIKPTTNKKFELNTDLIFDDNRLSITYFKERMTDAFRSNSLYSNIEYRNYDNTSIDLNNLHQKPNLSDFSFSNANEFYALSSIENGSQILKNGLEFQFMSKRFTSINTRFTVNGAYLKTLYQNSLPIWKINTAIIHNGLARQVSAKYLNDDGYNREMFSTNYTIDSYLPKLGLNLMASFQALWYTISQSMEKSGTPIAYKFADDNIERPFTLASLDDPTLKQLVETYSSNNFLRNKEPLDLQINLKASKSFKDYLKASVFVNRLLLYRPNYTTALGTNVSRSMDAPYFGMEITLSL